MQYRTSYSCTIVLSPRTAEGGGRLAFAGAPSLQRHIVPRQAITLRTSARKTSEGLSNAFKAMQPDLRPRLRLLALHSFRTSARIFAEQVRRSGLDKDLQDLVEFHFIDAPNSASGEPPADVRPFLPLAPFYEWWNAQKNEENGEWSYVGAEKSLQFVKECASRDGPFDGVVAMSQGTILTALLLISQQSDPPAQAGLLGRFCILMAGVAPRQAYLDKLGNSKLKMPSLHMIGSKDYVKPASYRLLSLFENPILIEHSRGHVVPPLDGEKLDLLRSFLHGQLATNRL